MAMMEAKCYFSFAMLPRVEIYRLNKEMFMIQEKLYELGLNT